MFGKGNTPNRRGVLMLQATGTGLLNRGMVYEGLVEVEEVERLGPYSKVKVLSFSGNFENRHIKEATDGPVRSSEIQWIELEGSEEK